MNKLSFMMTFAMAVVLTACNEKKQEQEAIPMQIETAAHVKISGNCASLVMADTTALVIVRDSVADEKVDTIYDIHTTLTLLLDSTFMADKMEGTLQLQINDVVFVPTDSTLAENLIAFMKSDAGTKTTIGFSGKAGLSKFLQLSEAANGSLIGFSFHELDPEAKADPEITLLINRFEKLAKEINKDIREFGAIGVGNARAEEIGCMKIRLTDLKSKMSPKQLERFQYITTHYQTYF